MMHSIIVEEIIVEDSDNYLSDLLPCTVSIIDNEVDEKNFNSVRQFSETLKVAQDECRRYLTSRLIAARSTILAFIGQPLSGFWLAISAVGLVGCLIFSIGAVGWAYLPFSPPLWLLPDRTWFAISWLLLGGGMILSLPWRLFPPFNLIYVWQNFDDLGRFIRNTKFKIHFGEREQHFPDEIIFTGSSAGLTLFCTHAEAIAKSDHQKLLLPWQRQLLKQMDTWAASAAVIRGGELGSVGEISSKVAAIWKSRERLTKVFFCLWELGEVRKAWFDKSGEMLPIRNGPTPGCEVAASARYNMDFIFCRTLDDFIKYLYPWGYSWVGLRLLAIVVIPFFSLFIEPPAPPEFGLSCVPTPCSFIGPRLYTANMEGGEPLVVVLDSTDLGYLGTGWYDLRANFPGVISSNNQPDQYGDHLRLPLIPGASTSFYFLMPVDPPPGGVVIDITASNKANKNSQATIFFEP